MMMMTINVVDDDDDDYDDKIMLTVHFTISDQNSHDFPESKVHTMSKLQSSTLHKEFHLVSQTGNKP